MESRESDSSGLIIHRPPRRQFGWITHRIDCKIFKLRKKEVCVDGLQLPTRILPYDKFRCQLVKLSHTDILSLELCLARVAFNLLTGNVSVPVRALYQQ